MTLLSCRGRQPRLHIAYIVDAYMHKCGKPFDTNVSPGNSLSRQFSNGEHPYRAMWELIHHFYKRMNWDALCDTEIDDMWHRATRIGLQVFNTKLEPIDVLSAQQRWHQSHWFRYEYKRTNRRMSIAPWLRLGAMV